jgi:hypothetical protein
VKLDNVGQRLGQTWGNIRLGKPLVEAIGERLKIPPRRWPSRSATGQSLTGRWFAVVLL